MQKFSTISSFADISTGEQGYTVTVGSRGRCMVQTWSLCNVPCAGYLSHITVIAELVQDTGEESPRRHCLAAAP